MTFNEADVNRKEDGKFGNKVGSGPEIDLSTLDSSSLHEFRQSLDREDARRATETLAAELRKVDPKVTAIAVTENYDEGDMQLSFEGAYRGDEYTSHDNYDFEGEAYDAWNEARASWRSKAVIEDTLPIVPNAVGWTGNDIRRLDLPPAPGLDGFSRPPADLDVREGVRWLRDSGSEPRKIKSDTAKTDLFGEIHTLSEARDMYETLSSPELLHMDGEAPRGYAQKRAKELAAQYQARERELKRAGVLL